METTAKLLRRPSVEALKPVAYRASQGISFSPEKRGESWMNDCENSLRMYLERIPAEMHATFEHKYVQMYGQWLGAMSRCISPMITGGSNFPTKRANKLNGYADNAFKRMVDWADKFVARCNRQHRLMGWDEIERLQEKVDSLQTLQNQMKAANKIVRSKKLAEVEKVDELVALGISEKSAMELIAPVEHWQTVGFAPYQLSNNLARIKDAQTRIARLTRMVQTDNRELEINGVTVQVCNSEERLRLCYDGKPNSAIITLLKQNGFKWSPSNSAWQRQLTDNAIYAAARVLAGGNGELQDEKEIRQLLAGKTPNNTNNEQ